GARQVVLREHGRVADGPVRVGLVELDDVVRAEVLGGGEAVEHRADPGGELSGGQVRGRGAQLGEVGVHGVGEDAGEHLPVPAVDGQGVADDLLADLGAVFEPADACFEVSAHAQNRTES